MGSQESRRKEDNQYYQQDKQMKASSMKIKRVIASQRPYHDFLSSWLPDLETPRPAQRGEVAERSEAGEGLPRFMPEGSGPTARRRPLEAPWVPAAATYPPAAFSTSRAMTNFWISVVPSPISASFTSRR